METKLKNEFNSLIKTISKEVIEESVVDSLGKVSEEIKNTVPKMKENLTFMGTKIMALNEATSHAIEAKKQLDSTTIKMKKVNDHINNLVENFESNIVLQNNLQQETWNQIEEQFSSENLIIKKEIETLRNAVQIVREKQKEIDLNHSIIMERLEGMLNKIDKKSNFKMNLITVLALSSIIVSLISVVILWQ